MMASLALRRSAWDWRTRLKWFPSILGIKVLVEHWRYHVLVVIVRLEFRRRQWQFEFCEDLLANGRSATICACSLNRPPREPSIVESCGGPVNQTVYIETNFLMVTVMPHGFSVLRSFF
jgi:hypothetical protein